MLGWDLDLGLRCDGANGMIHEVLNTIYLYGYSTRGYRRISRIVSVPSLVLEFSGEWAA